MRFGIMAMQVNRLIPADLPAGKEMEHIAGFDHAALVRQLAMAGFNPIELGGDLAMFMPQSFAAPAIQRLRDLKSEMGIQYTVHLPLWSVEPSTPQEPVRAGSVRAITDIIRATAPLAPEVYVLHAYGALAAEFYRMGLPGRGKALLLSLFQNYARSSLKMILSETGVPSRKLAVETIEFPCEMTLALAEEFDTSICFDTGHILSGFSGPVDFFEALDRCLPRLGQVHLHDSPLQRSQDKLEYGKDHQPLGAGDLDVGRLLDRLQQAHYAGPIVFELTVEQALASLQLVRKTRPQLVG
jgi:sugar phosphate isomerase/epimerase